MRNTIVSPTSVAVSRRGGPTVQVQPRMVARKRAGPLLGPKARVPAIGLGLAAVLLLPVLAWDPLPRPVNAAAECVLPPPLAASAEAKASAAPTVEDCLQQRTTVCEVDAARGASGAARQAAPRALPAPVGQVQEMPGARSWPSARSAAEARPNAQVPPRERAIERLLAAMRRVESGGNDFAVGDHGQSLGPLQAKRAAWADAGRQLAEERRDRARAAYRSGAVSYPTSCTYAKAYWRRYCPRAFARGDLEHLARTWNGGPDGASDPATLKYWRRVSRELD